MTLTPIIVCGSRFGAAEGEVWRGLGLYVQKVLRGQAPGFNHVVVGSDEGVDGEAFAWALSKEVIATVVPALWRTGGHGNAEGPRRNRRMPALFPPAATLAFAGGSGTASMKSVSRALGIPVWEWDGVTWGTRT